MKPRKTPPEAQATEADLEQDRAKEAREAAMAPKPEPVRPAPPLADPLKKGGIDYRDRHDLVEALARGFVLRDPQTRQILFDSDQRPLEFRPFDWEAVCQHFGGHIQRGVLEAHREELVRLAQELQRHTLPAQEHQRITEARAAQLKKLAEVKRGGGSARDGISVPERDKLAKALARGVQWEAACAVILTSPVKPERLAYWRGEVEKQAKAIQAER